MGMNFKPATAEMPKCLLHANYWWSGWKPWTLPKIGVCSINHFLRFDLENVHEITKLEFKIYSMDRKSPEEIEAIGAFGVDGIIHFPERINLSM